MRKNPKPLRIHVLEQKLYHSKEVEELESKGHIVTYCSDCEGMDVVIAPHCWRIDPTLGHLDKQLQMMVEGVRNIKYPKEKKI